MAEYKAIHGTLFQHKTSDPLAAGVANGSWATGGTKNTIINDGAGSGSKTAGLAFGGVAPPGITADTETYDGTSWTEVANLNAGRRSLTGTGTQTASFAIAGGEAGSFTAAIEEWDGSSWTETTDLNTTRGYNPGSSGTITAALVYGGRVNPNPSVTANTESWNGTSWTEVADLNLARYNAAGAGSQTASIYAAGHNNSPPGANLNVNELWDGTSWTEAAEVNTGRNGLGGTGDLNTDVLVFGGTGPATGETDVTESWNGTSWTEVADLAAPSEDFCSSAVGGGTSALRAAGNVSGSRSGASEEWTAAGITDAIQNDGQVFYRSDTGDFKVSLTQYGTGAWASGGTMGTTRPQASPAGTQTAGLVSGGASDSANAEK